MITSQGTSPGPRRMMVKIGDCAWGIFLGGEHRRYAITEGWLPHDARAVGCHHDGTSIAVIFESEHFEPVFEGDPIPELDIKVRSLG